MIEKNTAATEQMAANSTELTQQIESIASVSEENSAVTEEVSASVASLMDMAKNLQQIVAQFKLK